MHPIFICLLFVLPVIQDDKRTEPEPIYTAESEWIEVRPEEAGARVEMPAIPKHVTLEMPNVVEGQQIFTHHHKLTFNKGTANMTFIHQEILDQITNDRKKVLLLDGAVAGARARVFGTLLQHKKVFDKKKNAGRDFVYIAKIQEVDYKIATRIWLVGQTLYQMTLITTADVYDPAIAQKFFESFELVEKEMDLPPKPKKVNSK